VTFFHFIFGIELFLLYVVNNDAVRRCLL